MVDGAKHSVQSTSATFGMKLALLLVDQVDSVHGTSPSPREHPKHVSCVPNACETDEEPTGEKYHSQCCLCRVGIEEETAEK